MEEDVLVSVWDADAVAVEDAVHPPWLPVINRPNLDDADARDVHEPPVLVEVHAPCSGASEVGVTEEQSSG